ncbi:sporulation protein [Nocardia donostiensis]|uniref:SpoOM family protein n=1 Tax=Nocardia donostiensis TaxID=1538463 RepID=A0A1V2T9T6_9NOCA|nr:sporulation protein [Nocardia donostiensis]ONM46111.1 SpoOM family protein [Nocardia donostiensis]OQS12425.1 SpoOM family protein [Nocardia donostiensis]OQS17999.1 SpoOM family protein [Nocardia donostiensis]
MFKKLLAAVGVGGAEVETELFGAGVQPGGVLQGVIRLRGGQTAQRVTSVDVELVTRVEVEHDDGEYVGEAGFGRVRVQGGFELNPGASLEFPFGLRAPMETPITFYNNRHLPGTSVAVRTVVDLNGGVDAKDTDPIGVGALPAQHVILDAVERWGFGLRSADVESGRVSGTPQQLPFYQEIEFAPSPRFPRINQLEVTFVAVEHGMSVVMEADKRGGLLSAGRDSFDALWVDFAAMGQVDWVAAVGQRLERLASR